MHGTHYSLSGSVKNRAWFKHTHDTGEVILVSVRSPFKKPLFPVLFSLFTASYRFQILRIQKTVLMFEVLNKSSASSFTRN